MQSCRSARCAVSTSVACRCCSCTPRTASFHAVSNICSHAYAHLHEGRLRGHRVICPLHGASFDIRTGAVLGAPATVPIASYPVRVAGDQIEVQVRP